MATLHYMVGIVGTGKTYVANKLMETLPENTLLLDSDAIRAELFGDEACQDNPSLVFATMEKRTIEALNQGRDVIYCACNIWCKKRINFLKALARKVDAVTFNCYVINCSIETARTRNSARSRVVPSFVIDRQIRQFEIPTYGEGWHHIKIIDNNIDNTQDKVRAIVTYEERVKEFGSQQNSHHLLDLYDHCRMASHWARENNCGEDIVSAAYLHDWGKAWTAIRWEKDNYKEVHYPNHANVSAVLALNMGASLEVIALINYHMLLYTNLQCQQTWRNRLGERLWNKLILLHKADEAAH